MEEDSWSDEEPKPKKKAKGNKTAKTAPKKRESPFKAKEKNVDIKKRKLN
jgi:hypothetical protein